MTKKTQEGAKKLGFFGPTVYTAGHAISPRRNRRVSETFSRPEIWELFSIPAGKTEKTQNEQDAMKINSPFYSVGRFIARTDCRFKLSEQRPK